MLQALNQDNISISLYYRSVKDEENEFIACFICDGTALLSPFYHELDKYTDGLAEHLENPEPYLVQWLVNSFIEKENADFSFYNFDNR